MGRGEESQTSPIYSRFEISHTEFTGNQHFQIETWKFGFAIANKPKTGPFVMVRIKI
jgi:hypothetical protein